MNYFIFNFDTDLDKVESLLSSMAVAHKLPKRTKEWFLWKFRDNPYGESILACAEVEGEIIGCVAYGMQKFLNKGEVINGAMSFETFVHPNQQGKGIFGRLIKLSENAASIRKIQLLINFPNSMSLPGFRKKGWIYKDINEYWLKAINPLKLVYNVKNLKKSFISSSSNFKDLNLKELSNKGLCLESEIFQALINVPYLKWRFFTYPVSKYIVINNESFFSIAREGNRGVLKEVQVLYSISKNNESLKLKKLIREYKFMDKYDLISFPVSKNNPIKKKFLSNFIFKVPNNTNMCYKILDDTIEHIDVSEISINAINYHTY